jgi:hypothetical protein
MKTRQSRPVRWQSSANMVQAWTPISGRPQSLFFSTPVFGWCAFCRLPSHSCERHLVFGLPPISSRSAWVTPRPQGKVRLAFWISERSAEARRTRHRHLLWATVRRWYARPSRTSRLRCVSSCGRWTCHPDCIADDRSLLLSGRHGSA